MREDRLVRESRFTPAVGLLVAMLDECRGRTLSHLQDLDAPMIYAEVPGHPNTIGTILYHVAAIELDWLYAEILGEEFPEEMSTWFPADVRDDTGRLTPVTGESLDRHRERLAWVRGLLHDGLADKDDAFLFEDRPTDGGTVTSEWVLHHLMQHEAEHRGQIGELATALR
ncbi:MAG: DinB family protein [Acidimicrobiia bacterium]